MDHILVANSEAATAPRKAAMPEEEERAMRTLTTMIEWSAVAVAVYAAISIATSAPVLAALA